MNQEAIEPTIEVSAETPALPVLIGELLLQQQLISEQELDKALALQTQVGGRIGSLLVRSGNLSENKLLMALHQQLGFPRAGHEIHLPENQQIKQTAENLEISLDWLLDHKIFIWKAEDNNQQLYYCSRSLLDDQTHEALRIAASNLELTPVLATGQQLEKQFHHLELSLKHENEDLFNDSHFLREMAEEAPIVELVSNFMSQAMERKASDIHIEPAEDHFLIRLRIDGILHTVYEFPIDKFNAVASRIKLISGIDIAERRLPQDGRLSIRLSGIETDIRVSSLPGVYGESIVMRLLPKERANLQLEKLGMAPDHLELMKEWMREPNGIILVTGPTGSGKSTTLYGALDESNDGIRKIITVEDPVEFRLSGITQIQAHSEIGLTFASALRSILRQDPDVIMVGEIRDLETAEIAIQSALTGHLVLSTLHTNSALSAFTRLIDMGVEPFLVAAPLRAVQAQRLVRRLCSACSVTADTPEVWTQDLKLAFEKLYPNETPNWRQATGCSICHQTGYSGRLGIYELIPVTEQLQHLIASGGSQQQIQQQAINDGFRSLRDDGLIKACLGQTTIDEVMRVAMNRGL